MAGSVDIDWAASVAVGRRAAPTGPSISRIDAARAVVDLRAFSRQAELAVRAEEEFGARAEESAYAPETTVAELAEWLA